MKSLTFALTFLVVLLAWGLHAERAENKAKAAELRAAEHKVGTTQAALAEAVMGQAPHRVDTVRQIVSSVKTLRDSVMVSKTDTLLLERFVYRVDSLRAECLKCAALLDTIRLRYADEKRATESYISLLQGEVKRAKRMSWKDRVGCGIGYGVQKVGSDVYAGPQVGCQIRAWP